MNSEIRWDELMLELDQEYYLWMYLEREWFLASFCKFRPLLAFDSYSDTALMLCGR